MNQQHHHTLNHQHPINLHRLSSNRPSSLTSSSSTSNNSTPRPPMIPISINSSSAIPKPISSISSIIPASSNSSSSSQPHHHLPQPHHHLPQPSTGNSPLIPYPHQSLSGSSSTSLQPSKHRLHNKFNHSSLKANPPTHHPPLLNFSSSNYQSSFKLALDHTSSNHHPLHHRQSSSSSQANANNHFINNKNNNLSPTSIQSFSSSSICVSSSSPSSSAPCSPQPQPSSIPCPPVFSPTTHSSLTTTNSASSINSSLSSPNFLSSPTSSSPPSSSTLFKSSPNSRSSSSSALTQSSLSFHMIPLVPPIDLFNYSITPTTSNSIHRPPRLQPSSSKPNQLIKAYQSSTPPSSSSSDFNHLAPSSSSSSSSSSCSVSHGDRAAIRPTSPAHHSQLGFNHAGLIDIDFGPSFSHSTVQLADSLAESFLASSHPTTPTVDQHSDSPPAIHSASNSQTESHSLSSYPTHDGPRRDTLRSLSDLMQPALNFDLFNPESTPQDLKLTNPSLQPSSNNGERATLPSTVSSFNSLPTKQRHSTFPSSTSSSSSPSLPCSPPPTSFELIPDPTPKPKTSSLSAPSLLDLDISGRGPSTTHNHLTRPHILAGDGHQSGEDEDSDQDHQAERDLSAPNRRGSVVLVSPRYSDASNYSVDRPQSRQLASTNDNDPYPRTGLNTDDENDDNQSIQYTGSSCDDHRNPGQESISERSSPYLHREQSYTSSSSTQMGPSPKKSFNFFKRSHSKTLSGMDSDHQPNPNGRAQDSQSSLKPELADPSPVSSLTSFNTVGSKSSSKVSSSSRMARLISRVTGHTSLSSHSSASKRAPQQESPNLPQNSTPRPNGVPTKPIGRKASISNFLDTITITREKSKLPTSQPAANVNPSPSIVPRKSFDMLMRPFTGGKPRAAHNPDLSNSHSTSSSSSKLAGETPRKDLNFASDSTYRPLLKAQRSYDILRGKLGHGRKSMDDLSNTVFSPLRQLPGPRNQFRTGPLQPPDLASKITSAPHKHHQRAQSRNLPNRPLPGSQSAPTMSNLRVTNRLLDNDKDMQDKGSTHSSNPSSQISLNVQSDATHSVIPKENGLTTADRNNNLPPSRPENAKSTNPIKDCATIVDDQSIAEWNALESILYNLQSQRNSTGKHQNPLNSNAYNRNDLTAGLTKHLLPFLKAEESQHGSIYIDQSKGDRHRQILFGWLELIFDELQEPQPASRAACLDGVSGILESHFFASRNINSNVATVKKYTSVLISVVKFAVDKLNDKAVYANTLVFAGRMLSLAFFRIESVGRKLLRALPPVKRMSMRRLLDEMGSPENSTSSESPNLNPFPSYLRELCFVDLASYYHVFSSPSTESDNLLVQEGDVQIEMSGNWLIRWTASDSDLPFAFYRAYHRQLATYLRPQQQTLLHPSTLISMPGFLFISASFLDKCDSLVHRSLRSVTTLGPTSNNFNAGESANLAMGAKPKVLELAHRRLVSTALDIIGGPPATEDGSVSLEDNGNRRRQFFGGLLNLWIRAIAKRTSMWDTRSVFLLLDLLDALFYTVLYTAPLPQADPNGESQLQMVPKLVESALEVFDLKFILDITRRILLTADNTVCILRTIAFIYSQFEAFTNSPEMLKATCLDLLLDPQVFQHLFLHWNSGVRGYYMRLLVWRLSRLGGVTSVAGGTRKVNSKPKSKEAIKIILAFNARLDAIRKRHDELSPQSQFLTTQDDDRRRRRTTICSTRGVSDKPWAISELPPEEVCAGTIDDAYGYSTSSDKPVAKVVSWLKVVKRLGGSSSKQKCNRQVFPNSDSPHLSHLHQQPDDRQPPSPPRLQQLEHQNTQPQVLEPARSPHLQASHSSKPLDQSQLSEIDNDPNGRKSESRPRSMNAHAPDSPTFFQFEFELGAEIPRSDSFDTPLATTPTSISEPVSPIHSTGSMDGRNSKKHSEISSPNGKGFPSNHENPNNNGNNVQVSVEPRVSIRFSKRASLLPPAALNMLKDNNEEVPEVPSLPEQYKQKDEDHQKEEIMRRRKKEEEEERKKMIYDKSKHAYAVKALAEYEQSLEEEFEWNEKLLEEQDAINENLQNQDPDNHPNSNSSVVDNTIKSGASLSNLEYIVPRLAVSWPLSFSDED